MKRSFPSRILVAAFLMAALTATGSFAADEPTLDEILAMNYEARGGADKIAAMNTIRATGTAQMGPGMEAPFTIVWKRPDMFRVEFSIQGMTGVQAYDGETAWMHFPFMGQTAPELMSEEDTEQTAETANFEGPLFNWKEKGNEVEYVGMEEVEGTETYKIKVTFPSGNVSHFFLDTEYGLEIMDSAKRSMMGNEVEVDTIWGDYKETAGLVMPHSREQRMAGAPGGQVFTIDEYEVNVEIDDGVFAMPEAETEEAEKAASGG